MRVGCTRQQSNRRARVLKRTERLGTWLAPLYGCGVGGFPCSDSTTSFNLYTGGMFNNYFGAEIGYVNFGKAKHGGGRTEVSASVLSGIPTGKESGWEGSYGAGVGFDLSPRSSIVLEWARHELRFAGVGKREIDTTSIGYVHRF